MMRRDVYLCFFFFNDTATTEIYTLSLHDALPICVGRPVTVDDVRALMGASTPHFALQLRNRDRKSTRLNSSHANISYAVFCLKKKNNKLSSSHVCTLFTPISHILSSASTITNISD